MCDKLQFILKIGQAHFWELRGGGNEKNNNYSQGGRWNVQTFSRLPIVTIWFFTSEV